MADKRFRILSLDGGGIRGLLTAIVLQRLESRTPGWLDQVDLIAGTSTGGIIALGLARGLKADDLRALYEKNGKKIFHDSWLDNALDFGKSVGADYDNKYLRRELKRIFGTTRLRDLKKHVLIPAFDLDNEKPDAARRGWDAKFFHNFHGGDSDGDTLAYKVALYSSAAPTYFPSVDGYIDGGVIANNPSMAALAQTQDARSLKKIPNLRDIVLLSLGTGKRPEFLRGKRLDWGYAQWAKPLVNIMLDGAMNVADYQCRQLLRENYMRFQPVLLPDKAIELDDVRRIPGLVAIAESVNLDPVVKWLQKHWN